MSDGVTITSLEIENVKRIRALRMVLAEMGLTLIGGGNGQGKTSVLDALMGALGGDAFRQPVREGAEKGVVRVALSNGITVERVYTAGGGSRLKVEDTTGKRCGQALLGEFVSQFALNVGEFMSAPDKRKAEILLKVIGVNPQPFEERIRTLEADRLLKGRESARAKGNAESLPFFEDAGAERLDGNSISAQMTEALSHNARIRQASGDIDAAKDRVELAAMKVKQAEEALKSAQESFAKCESQLAAAKEKALAAGQPVDTQAISKKLQEVTEYNERVSGNLARKHAQELAEQFAGEYKEIQAEIDSVREELRALLEGANLPYPGLGVNNGVLEFNGRPWSALSESERLILATAVSRAVMPQCKFVLIDGMERMDRKTLRTFTGWLVAQGLQAIGTRVGDGDECSIIIEDGVAAGSNDEPDFS